MIKIVANRCHSLKLNAPNSISATPLRKLIRPTPLPRPLSSIYKGPTSKGKEGRGREGEVRGRKEPKGRGKKGVREVEGVDISQPDL